MQTTIDTEIHIDLEDRPGALGQATEALGERGVNILGFLAETREGRGRVRLVTDAPAQAVKALDDAGVEPTTSEVLLVRARHEPGELSRIATTLGESGVNVRSGFPIVGSGGRDVRLALDVDDVPSARKVLGG